MPVDMYGSEVMGRGRSWVYGVDSSDYVTEVSAIGFRGLAWRLIGIGFGFDMSDVLPRPAAGGKIASLLAFGALPARC